MTSQRAGRVSGRLVCFGSELQDRFWSLLEFHGPKLIIEFIFLGKLMSQTKRSLLHFVIDAAVVMMVMMVMMMMRLSMKLVQDRTCGS